jgi:hypothetical protein
MFGQAWDNIKKDPWGDLAAAGVIALGVGLMFVPGGQVIGAGILIGAATSAGLGLVTGKFDPQDIAMSGMLGGIGAGAGAVIGGLAASTLGTDATVAEDIGVAARARTFKFGNLPPDLLGSTDINGNITIQHGLTDQVFRETFRHELVHSFLAGPPPLNRVTFALYKYSNLYRYAEEAAAETAGKGNLWYGLKYPLMGGYDITVPRLGAELAGVGAASGVGYGIYEWAR